MSSKISQLNSLAGRMNQILIESQIFAFTIKIVKTFLGEALLIIIHVINLSLAVALKGDIQNKV